MRTLRRYLHVLSLTLFLIPTCVSASDKLAALLMYSSEIGVASVLKGESEGTSSGSAKYTIAMQHDLFNAGRRHSKSEVLECNCQLKVGSQYLLFIVAAKDSTYIRAAYEVLPGDSAEARFAAKGEPIVLITDTDRLGTNYLLLSGKFPTSYQEKVVTSMDNVSHEFPTNAWYLLKDVQDEINGYMAEHPRK